MKTIVQINTELKIQDYLKAGYYLYMKISKQAEHLVCPKEYYTSKDGGKTWTLLTMTQTGAIFTSSDFKRWLQFPGSCWVAKEDLWKYLL